MNYELDPSQGFYRDSVEALIRKSADDPRRVAIERIAQIELGSPLQIIDPQDERAETMSEAQKRAQHLRADFHQSLVVLLDLPLNVPEGFDRYFIDSIFSPEKSLRTLLEEYRSQDESSKKRMLDYDLRKLIGIQMEEVTDKMYLKANESIKLKDESDLSNKTKNAILRSTLDLNMFFRTINGNDTIKPLITNLGTLSAYTEIELSMFKNVGLKAIDELKRILEKYDLSLAG